MEIIKAKVTNILLDKYVLKDLKNGNEFSGILRGNIKKSSNLVVGDVVECEKSYDKYMINKILPRTNFVIRPPVANIDQMIIVLSIDNPSPDYVLLDKELILCKSKNITPVICINKMDLAEDDIPKKHLEYIKRVYGNLNIDIIYVSADKKEGLDSLYEILKNKTSAFSGNSGVGKSSLTKVLLNKTKDYDIEVGQIGKKTKRGKHTTKHVKLYELSKDTYLFDTPGFSSYELYDIEYRELKNYYDEFKKCHCEYDDCNHVIETSKVCDVKRNVEKGIIDKDRYERYVYLFTRQKQIDDKKYKR